MAGPARRDARPERAAIEWHDSELVALTDRPDALLLDLRAIVLRSHGRPGLDVGTVRTQPAALLLTNPRRVGPRPTPPVGIAVDRIETETSLHDNLVPCPFPSSGPIVLDLSLASGETLRYEADRLTVTVTGEPEFLEDFMPDDP